mmetsp:Transcript_786/g.2014  ORF Transcript_786/g.2014 Transcript_786/m.2014 type:complete len:213 (+) Transcript_786:1625-2263(+)
MAMVMGPTPPGTGVMCAATSLAAAKSTSPTSRYPRLAEGSSTALMPTSITAQPGLSQAPCTNLGRPHAATTMSASRMKCSGSGVRECTTVTVALRSCKSMAAGVPTMLLRPTTTARLPEIATPVRSSSSMHPFGVQHTKLGVRPRIASFPMFSGWNPSTSFSMLIAVRIFSSLMCLGKGSWTKMPCTLGSALYASTTCKTSSSVAVSGRSVP